MNAAASDPNTNEKYDELNRQAIAKLSSMILPERFTYDGVLSCAGIITLDKASPVFG